MSKLNDDTIKSIEGALGIDEETSNFQDENIIEVEQIDDEDIINDPESFELIETEKTIENEIQEFKEDVVKDIIKDYKYTRKNLRSILKTGRNALGTLAELCEESEQPRMYEVLATMIKNLGDVGDKLIDLQQKIKDVQSPKSKQGNDNFGNNNIKSDNVFICSTSDLQEMVKNAQIDDIIEIEPDDDKD